MLFRLSYYAVKPDGTIVLSFPASHDLAITSIGNLKDIKYIYGGSHNLKKICSFPHAKGFRSYESHDIWSWYMRTPSYEGILYDKYRNIYYRIARLPNKEYKLGDNGNEKPVIVVVLDEDFHYLGETMLPKDLNLFSSNIFVSKEGLNVQVVDSNEDILKFYRYVYAKVH